MKTFFLRLLRNRIIISAIGVLCLIALVWWVGPLISIGSSTPLGGVMTRVVVIVIILALWALYSLYVYMKAKYASGQMMQGIAQADAETAQKGKEQSNEEIGILQERFGEAMEVLKKSGSNIYELPWYIIIGPPGSGKTTALVNSGLNFPLAERFGKDAVRGVGGTRNCDWWFTDNAVLLDTAGRYVTQDSHAAADSAAWIGFLKLLKKHRKRRPINGAMVAISLADLLVQTEQEQAAHVRAIKLRLQELREQLGIRFPVYVLFTKSDLVAGFMEFFDDLGREEREQVWGLTLPMDDSKNTEGVVQHFGAEFDALVARINDRVLTRLNQERDVQRRALIYAFPQQIAALRETALRFLEEVFRPSRFEDRALLRGVYFTSGTQEGTPIDRLMGVLAGNFGLDRQALPSFGGGRGRSYFITRLIKDVIFAEAGMAGANRRFERQRAWLQRGSYAGALGATALAALAWSTSGTRNGVYVHNLKNNVEAYQTLAQKPAPVGDLIGELPILDAARATTTVYSVQEKDGRPFLMGMGLYQGDKLAPAADAAYYRTLESDFLPRLGARLEAQLHAGAGNPDFQYEALKTYLMLGDKKHLDPEHVKTWMALDWGSTLPNDKAKQDALKGHLDTLLAGDFKPLALNEGLVSETRYTLNQVPVAQRVYGRLKKDGLASTEVKPFRLTDLGPEVARIFVRGSGKPLDEPIPGFFTQAGFYRIFMKESPRLAKREADESWVLGNNDVSYTPAQIKQLTDDVRKLYLDDYIQRWDALMNDLNVVRFGDLHQAAAVLAVMSSPTSPIRAVLQALEHNTNLNRVPVGDGLAGGLKGLAGKASAVTGAVSAADAEKERLAKLMAAVPGASADVADALPAVEAPGGPVVKHFERINATVRAPSGAAPIDGVMGVLSEVYGYLNSIAGSSGGAAMDAVRSRSGGGSDALRSLQIEAARQPDPLKRWLQDIAQSSVGVMMGGTRAQLNTAYQAAVLPNCQRALMNRYPLYRDASSETTLEDFGRFFGPGGVMDEFFKTNLKDFVDTSRSTWSWRSSDGMSLGLSNSVLAQFQRAARIKEMFFRTGGQTPSVSFGLKPLYLDANVSEFMLDLDGQQVIYQHGPTRISNVTWPSAAGTGQVRIQFKDASGSGATDSADGPWAWFRILDKAEIKEVSSDVIDVSFEIGWRKAQFELRANSVLNPFTRRELEQFRCPANL